MKYQLEINQKNFDVTIQSVSGNMAHVLVNGQSYDVRIGKSTGAPAAPGATAAPAVTAAPSVVADTGPAVSTPAPTPAPKPRPPAGPVEGEPILAPIPGLILDVKVKVGDTVDAGQTVAIMEAMKMENSLVSHVSGTVQDVRVQKGSEVSTGDVIMIVG
ncbi:MAG: biotin/lipoyl-containing protein [Desulfatirhabdiaceae bacterium]